MYPQPPTSQLKLFHATVRQIPLLLRAGSKAKTVLPFIEFCQATPSVDNVITPFNCPLPFVFPVPTRTHIEPFHAILIQAPGLGNKLATLFVLFHVTRSGLEINAPEPATIPAAIHFKFPQVTTLQLPLEPNAIAASVKVVHVFESVEEAIIGLPPIS